MSSPICVLKEDKLVKDVFVFKETPVRGKARLQLEGWDCADCKKVIECICYTQFIKKNK